MSKLCINIAPIMGDLVSDFRPVNLNIESGTMLLHMTLATHFFPWPAMVRNRCFTCGANMIFCRSVTILALHIG